MIKTLSEVAADFLKVSVSGLSDSVVWGVSPSYEVFISESGSGWKKVEGPPDLITVVSVGEAGVWGVGKDGGVWYRTGANGRVQR